MAEIYKVCELREGSLFVMPKPGKSGQPVAADLEAVAARGVDVVVSLLQPEEQVREALEDEEGLCEALGMTYLNFPIEDHSVPEDLDATRTFIAALDDLLKDGHRVAIHCKGGVGRTGSIAGALMIACGYEPDAAFETLAAARGKPMPGTAEQRAWVAAWA